MEVDWFTVGAQLVNFAVLFWLLSKFLYRPIIDAVETRRATISDKLEEANEREQQAEDVRQAFEARRDELDERREAILQEARDEAEALREERIEELRRDIDELRSRWLDRLASEQRRQLDAFADHLQRELFATARDALDDLADVDVESKIVDRFVAKLDASLRGDDDQLAEEIADELNAGQHRFVVRASFELPAERRDQIAHKIEQLLAVAHTPGAVDIEFEVDDQLIAGIELRVGARRIGWHIGAYLESLRDELGADPAFSDPRAGWRTESSAASSSTSS